MVRFLIDADETSVVWSKKWDLRAAGHEKHGLRLTKDQTTFNLYEHATEEGKRIINAIMDEAGYYSDLPPMPGAKEAIFEMIEEGHDVRIVTAPWVTNKTCASDKIEWFEREYGPGWGKRVIITSDKTLIRGDILIDDKPYIEGSMEPEWEHVRFTAPYNKHLNDKRRLTEWKEWRGLLVPAHV